MESSQNESKNEHGLWALLKKACRRLCSPDWTPKDPNQPKTAQDHRDELLSKCPWKDFW